MITALPICLFLLRLVYLLCNCKKYKLPIGTYLLNLHTEYRESSTYKKSLISDVLMEMIDKRTAYYPWVIQMSVINIIINSSLNLLPRDIILYLGISLFFT